MFQYSTETYFEVDPNQIIVDARSFSDWRNGLPEWMKNSSDAYERAAIDVDDRVIVVIFAWREQGKELAALACLDFVGMDSTDLTSKLARYGDPEASGSGPQVVGGHGNGGKLFAVGGFKGGASWLTFKDGLRNEYGLPDPGRPELAFRIDGEGKTIQDRPSGDMETTLESWLKELNLTTSDLPDVAREVAKTANGLTLVAGFGPEQFSQPLEAAILGALRGHTQCRTPLETARVYVIADGKLLNGGKPLVLEDIDPYEGFFEPRIIPVPSTLHDPDDQTQVETGSDGQFDVLDLRTSAKRMPSNKTLRGRHTIDYKQGSKIRGSKAVVDHVSKGPFTDRVYGECRFSELTESFESQTRGPLVPTPLTRALEQWIDEQILGYASEIEQQSAMEEKAAQSEQKTQKLIEQMARLNNWINRIVDEISLGAGDELDIDGGGPKPPIERSRLPVGVVGKIEISINGTVAGAKVPLEFSSTFFGSDHTTRVRPVSVTWHCSDPAVASYSPVTGRINTYQPGTAEIWCESAAGIKSNRITVTVVDCSIIDLDVSAVELRIGERRRIHATGITSTGEKYEGIRVNWITDAGEVARIGLGGIATGLTEGNATLTAREGDGTFATCVVAVIPGKEGPSGPGRSRFLLSEVQKAPYDETPPVFHKDYGLVTQRQQDIENNIWWINLASPLARFVYDQRGEVSEQWAMYLGERMADAAIEAAMQGADGGVESRPVNEILNQVSEQRMRILESFTEEFGATKQLVI